MKPNVLFFVVDSLRSDICYGVNGKSVIQNINFLISNGTRFNQAISCGDGTALAIGSVFTGLYPFESGISTYILKSTKQNYFNHLSNNGYQIYTTIPKSLTLNGLISNFGQIDQKFHFQSDFSYLSEGYGDEIISRLENKTNTEPWIHFIYLSDLHWPRIIPSLFNDIKFGSTEYEKALSVIDFWMGKFLKQINFEQTLVILTADHGEYIPIKEKRDLDYKPTLKHTVMVGKKFLPKYFHPKGKKIIESLRNIIQNIRFNFDTRNLSEYEKRTLLTRAGWFLYDELLNVPLVFSGFNVKKHQSVNKQVSIVDIFPTILDIAGIPQLPTPVHGRSLIPLINNDANFVESVVYLASTSININKMKGNVIGVRTPQYKYFRSRESPTEHVNLFDLINDPLEQNNICNKKKEICKKMEIELSKFLENSDMAIQNDESEMKKIENELRKLGYI